MEFHTHATSETANKPHTRKTVTGNPGLDIGGIVELEKMLKSREHNTEFLGSRPKIQYTDVCFHMSD